jgi:uncharacterized protein
MASLKVKVVPGSSRTKIDGWLGEFLKIRVTAEPQKGRANEAVAALLAETIGVPRRDVNISSGRSSSRKTFKITGLSYSEICSKLAGTAG